VLSTDTVTPTFLAGSFVLARPYAQCEFPDSVLDVLIGQSLDVFNSAAAGLLAKLAPREPVKVLTLIALYSEELATLENPWPMIDLLFQSSDAFSGTAGVREYVALLSATELLDSNRLKLWSDRSIIIRCNH
jgi:hypothetical protein